jgi:hypothetical protein
MRLASTLVAIVVTGLARAAVAQTAPVQQPWLSDRRFGEGMGIRVGNLELHPGVAAELGYDSNYFQRSGEDEEPTIAAYRLRLTPSISLSTLGGRRLGLNPGPPPAFTFRASAYASYNELFAADSDYSEEVSDQRHVDVGVSLNAVVAPQRPFSLDFIGEYQRVGEASNDPDTQFAFDRGTARGGAGLTWRPGGGLFDWRVGYDVVYNYFESDNYELLENVQQTLSTRGRWRFLPRTALAYDGSYTFVRYMLDDPFLPQNGDILRSRIGLTGLITNRLAFLGMIGWLATFYPGVPENADTPIGQAELKYFIMASPTVDPTAATLGLSSIAVGYNRDVSNSYLAAYYVRDRIYANFSYFFGGVVLASLEGGYSFISNPEDVEFEESQQQRFDARLFAEYRLSDIVGLNATVRYDSNSGDQVRSLNGALVEDIDFQRWQAYAGVRVFW